MSLNSPIDPPTYSITGFCEAHRIGRSFFYKLLKEGRAPRTMEVGRRRLVSREAAAAWREQMTKETEHPSRPLAQGQSNG